MRSLNFYRNQTNLETVKPRTHLILEQTIQVLRKLFLNRKYLLLGKDSNNQNGNLRWFLPLGV